MVETWLQVDSIEIRLWAVALLCQEGYPRDN